MAINTYGGLGTHRQDRGVVGNPLAVIVPALALLALLALGLVVGNAMGSMLDPARSTPTPRVDMPRPALRRTAGSLVPHTRSGPPSRTELGCPG